MKYFLFIIGLFLFSSCDENKSQYICVCANITDTYPKRVKKMEYDRMIYYELRFRNGSRDSVFFPFKYSLDYESFFYIQYKKYQLECSANWLIASKTFTAAKHAAHIIAPGEYVRIFIRIFPEQLKEIHIKEDIDIQELEKMITVHYKYNPKDAILSHINTPKIEVKKYGNTKLLYGKYYAPKPEYIKKRQQKKKAKSFLYRLLNSLYVVVQ